MKNLLYFIAIVTFSVSFSQENTIPAGEYKSTDSQQEKVTILMQENKRYSVSVFSGVYEQKNDSIFFKSDEYNEPTFKLEFGYEKSKSKKVLLNFDGLFLNYGDDKYIGVQETATSEIVYKTVQEFTNFKALDYNDEIKYEIDIDHCYALYFVKELVDLEAIIEKFILPKDVTSIKVNYNKSNYNQVNLTGYYNPTTKVLSVGSNGRNVLDFEINKSVNQTSIYVKPSENKREKKWTYQGKKAIEEYSYGEAVDSAAVAAYDIEPATPAYTFKLKIEKSLKEAFQTFKNSKDKSRFLVIINDTKNKNIETEFNEFIKLYEENLSYSMYEGYNKELDHFDFYLANDKDKAALKKYGITDNPSISYFNTNGTKLYFSNEKITDDNFSYYNMSTVFSELQILDYNAKLDATFSNKKSSNQEVLDAFYEITKQEVPYTYVETEALPVAVDIQDLVPPKVVEKVIEVKDDVPPAVDEIKTVEIIQDYPVDSTAVVDSAYNYDYSMLKIKENKYKFKSNEAQVNNAWIKILESHQQDKVINRKLALTIIKELNNKGFNRILFNKNQILNSKINHINMDYILKHYDTISNFNNISEETAYDGDYYSTYNFKETFLNLLNQNVIKQNFKTKDDLAKSMARFKSFLAISKNDSSVASSYMTALKDNDYQTEFLSAYENYYTTVINDNSSIIEQLDKAFEIKQQEEYSANWVEYKYDFANQANEASWFVVEKVKDASLIKKAIVWSVTSLKIQKDDRYYLDTLAQLYYKDGQKEKAIITEQKAIDVLSDDDYLQREEYKVVLEKMKNGTY